MVLYYSSNNLGILVQSSRTFQNHYWPINLMSGLASRPRPSTSRKTMNVTNAYWFRLWTSNLNINWLLLAYTGVPATWSDMSQVGELRWMILNDGACMKRMWPPKKSKKGESLALQEMRFCHATILHHLWAALDFIKSLEVGDLNNARIP